MSEEEKNFIKSLKTQCKGAREIFKDSCCQLPISHIEKIIDIIDKQEEKLKKLKEELTLYKAAIDEANRIFEENYSKEDK